MRRRAELWALLSILLLAFALRLFRLGAPSLWYDETVSVYLAELPVPDLIAHTAGDIHPPGYYLLLHAWTRLAGRSEFAAAFLSLWFGMLLVALAYRLGARVFGRSAGLLAALLVALSPYNLWYSQEVRMYTLGAALGVGALWFVVILITGPRSQRPAWPALVAYAVLAALGLWVLYYFAFLLVALNLLVLAWWLAGRRAQGAGLGWLGRWLAAQGLVVLLYAPWIPVAWRQATTPPVPPWRSLTPVGRVIIESWSALSLGQAAEPARVWLALVLTALLFGLGLVSGWLRRRGEQRPGGDVSSTQPAPRLGDRAGACMLAGYVLAPLVLIWLASFVSPLYHVRYVFTYSTPYYVILAAGLAWLWQRWRPAMWTALAVLVAFSAVAAWTYHTDVHYAADDHRAATRFVEGRWRPGDAILVDAGYVYTALLTYWDGEPIGWRGRLVSAEGLDYGDRPLTGPVVLLAGTVGGDAALGWGDPRSDFYAMRLVDTEAALSKVFADFNRVWLYRCYDTVTDPEGVIRSWLDRHGELFEDQVFTGESQLRVQGYLTGRDPFVGTVRVDEVLGDNSLDLLALRAPTAPVPVGGHVDVALVWRVGDLPKDGRILFAGLFASGQRWAQTDVRSLGSLYPVESWMRGEVVRTPLRVHVAAGTPPGRYRLEIGWYRFVDAQPTWIPWDSGNLLLAGEVDVIAPSDWWALPLPAVRERLDVTIGHGLRLEGLNGGTWLASPGELVRVELVWQASWNEVEPATTVLVLTDDAGRVVSETAMGASPPTLEPGQAVHVVESLPVPQPGIYSLAVGRRQPDGSWLPVRRGVFSLGATMPLGTVYVVVPAEPDQAAR